MEPGQHNTMSEMLDDLKAKGFDKGFKLQDQQLLCLENGKSYRASEISIMEYHRFEGESNPSDMSIVFAIRCSDGQMGAVISSFGTYADVPLLTFMEKVRILDRTKVNG